VLEQRKRDVIGNGQTVEQRRVLKDKAKPCPQLRHGTLVEPIETVSIESDGPLRRCDQAD
jgi:hypothetical protein